MSLEGCDRLPWVVLCWSTAFLPAVGRRVGRGDRVVLW